jgi:hypothetical protein
MAAFQKALWSKWTVHNPLSQATISHEEWQSFLTRFVITDKDGVNLVNYSKLTKADTASLQHYNRNEQLAFWINLYNATTVKIVADYYPVNSIQDINLSPGIFSIGPWDSLLVTIEGIPLSLDDVQNRIIRPIWNDPRTHYALNDSTIGAANLSKEAFTGRTINHQLNQVARQYINSLRGVQVIDGKLILSKIYDWYLDDFGGEEPLLIQHLLQFSAKPLIHQLASLNGVDGYVYNWHLNRTNNSLS